jgi:mannitol-specific phosphotransferase system IIBC component
MLFAVSDVVWQAVIAAVVTLVLAWMNQRTKNAVKDAAAETKADGAVVAEKVVQAASLVAGHAEEVKTTLATSTSHMGNLAKGQTSLAEQIEEVRLNVNGLTEKMGDAREAKGKADEQSAQRDRDQVKLEHKPGDTEPPRSER